MTWPRRMLAAGLIAAIVLAALAWLSAPDLEAISRTEPADIQAIVDGILTIQTRDAASQHRPLARGTHAKGICAIGQFEVNDVIATMPDRALATRLARGLYATPAKYSATVRFANADSNVNPDEQHDVRALSFSLDPTGTHPRLDFSTNDRSTFPINDAHAFATTVKVVTAPSMARGVWGLSFMDKLAFARTAVLGYEQEHQQTLPYQRRRYWSTVPFRHGPSDVIKYSATPCASNPGGDLRPGDPNALQNELIRHLDGDTQMSCFDFGLQLLDTSTMTYWGRRRDASFWIENASIAWPEAEAPFHTVGRLTLNAKSQLAPPACEAHHIDVTENSTPDSAPLGSINRARWRAESASRAARLSKPSS